MSSRRYSWGILVVAGLIAAVATASAQQGPERRIDFSAEAPAPPPLTPVAPYMPSAARRIDFSAEAPAPGPLRPVAPYAPAPPRRIDFSAERPK